MVKDGKMRADRYVDIIIECLAVEESDAIFETQLEFVHTAINTYSPIKFRQAQNDRVFDFILHLIPKIPENKKNRLIALRGKFSSFAQSQSTKKQLLDWHLGKLEALKGH